MIVLGCDTSLAATGLLLWDNDEKLVVASELVRTAKDDDNPFSLQERVHYIWRRVNYWAKRSDRIALEKLAPSPSNMDNRPAAVFEVVCYRLWRQHYMFSTVANNTVKKHGTGNGNASKDQMVEAAVAAGFIPEAPKSLAHNLADAYWVARWYADTKL